MNWKDPRGLDLEEADERLLRNILDNREVTCSRQEDKIIWCGAKSGSYSVKLGYTLLETEGRKGDWEAKVCWNKECLPKAGAFSWLAGNKRILTGDRLKRMGFVGPFQCVLYKKEEEEVDHLLLNCDFAQEAWRFGLQRLLEGTDVWEVWKERNRRLFEDKAETLERFLIKLERAISELVTNAASQVNLAKTPFTQFDAGILVSWPLIKFRSVNGLLRVNPHRKGDKSQEWVPLDKGWIKVNFDGASRGNLGISRVGVIARDEYGSILAFGAKRLVDGTNNEAECQAAIEAILLEKKLDAKKLHLEGDS
ncbi:uncharacterized protein LOC131858570 [Cryptomeria japonica]|uniref:uncharacterized protein LOC131858570 n=1 Tax=Cryptomeria japonica TaxID=3369 RepID=UPI0027DA883F|nr:uncharacterized protein LOC131858570 [Cryptomeria japonica]